jgi:hypothetical protein
VDQFDELGTAAAVALEPADQEGRDQLVIVGRDRASHVKLYHDRELILLLPLFAEALLIQEVSQDSVPRVDSTMFSGRYLTTDNRDSVFAELVGKPLCEH